MDKTYMYIQNSNKVNNPYSCKKWKKIKILIICTLLAYIYIYIYTHKEKS